ncbi:AhpC/TSA antioxidant enzyme-domain-containing protein [Pisolithus marmoratus]|nr:AhpC/TSA antioxidant enzyme-domain-containing protein [Pisolithus marmoratus]
MPVGNQPHYFQRQWLQICIRWMFRVLFALQAGALMYEPLTDADLGYLSDSRIPLSRPHTSHNVPVNPMAPRNVHTRSQTMDGRLKGASQPAGDGSSAPQLSSVPLLPYLDFDEHALPTPKQLTDAASCVVIAENGIRVPFGDLFKEQKTIVIFIRHFWCSLCQDYMFSLSSTVDPNLLKQADVNLVVVGNGSFNMIKSYRQIFRTPFAIYTDPSMRLHRALGMKSLQKTGPKPQTKRGGYIRHGKVNGMAMVVANALRVGMPIWEKGGDPSQLGGEFVFGPGLTVTFAHRMPNASCHAPILRVLAAAGVSMGSEAGLPAPEPSGRSSARGGNKDQCMEERHSSLAKIRERKTARRTGIDFPTCAEGHSVSSVSSSPTGHLPSPLSANGRSD